MITVIIDEARHTVSITGHAEYGPEGKDIVCAGVSVLFYGFCEAVRRAGNLHEFRADKGDSFCRFRGSRSDAKRLMVLRSGIELLEGAYPDNVRLADGEIADGTVCYDDKKEVSACT